MMDGEITFQIPEFLRSLIHLKEGETWIMPLWMFMAICYSPFLTLPFVFLGFKLKSLFKEA